MDIILLFFSALFFAYLLEPLCSRAEIICNSRAIASLLAIVFALLMLTVIGLVLLHLSSLNFKNLEKGYP